MNSKVMIEKMNKEPKKRNSIGGVMKSVQYQQYLLLMMTISLLKWIMLILISNETLTNTWLKVRLDQTKHRPQLHLSDLWWTKFGAGNWYHHFYSCISIWIVFVHLIRLQPSFWNIFFTKSTYHQQVQTAWLKKYFLNITEVFPVHQKVHNWLWSCMIDVIAVIVCML